MAWIWCLLLAFIVPEIGTLVRSMRICFFKSCKRPQLFDFLFVLGMETLHVFGLVLLVYVVLPNLDVIKGAMLTNCLCFVPAFLSRSTVFITLFSGATPWLKRLVRRFGIENDERVQNELGEV